LARPLQNKVGKMATPKGMRAQRFLTASGDAVHIYSDKEKIVLQIRREVPTETDLLSSSYKVAVELSDDEVLAIAGELLTAVSQRRRNQSKS
jgi:hypothetical protein